MDRFDCIKPETSQPSRARHVGAGPRRPPNGGQSPAEGQKSMNPSRTVPIIDRATLRELREALQEFEETKGDWSLDH
jgi:hypothetical protein